MNKRLAFIIISLFLLFIPFYIEAQTDNYSSIINSADHYLKIGDYLNAKAAYQYALRFKQEDPYAKSKLEECIIKLKSESSTRINYSNLLQAAEKFLKNKEYHKAIENYRKASQLFSYEEYPKQQIKRINETIKAQAQLENEYNQSIKKADQFFIEGKYSKSRLEYQYALGLKEESKHAKKRLKEIQNVYKGMENKIKLYEQIIKEANAFYNDSKWELSLEQFKKAIKLFPNKSYPQKKIKELLPLISQFIKYNKVIKSADEFYSVKDYNSAKTAYKQALKIKPGAEYPKKMLDQVEHELKLKASSEQQDFDLAVKTGDQYFRDKIWGMAKIQYEFANRLKPDEEYVKDQLMKVQKFLKIETETIELQKKHDEFIASADLWFEAKEYKKALKAYQQAHNLKFDTLYSRSRINEIRNIQEQLAKEKKSREEYYLFITKADQQFKNKAYIKAKLEYENALSIFSHELYPKQKIAEIQEILNKLAAIQTKEENYRNAIELADSYFSKKEYKKSKASYQQSILYKDDQYAKDRLIEIKNILDERAQQIELAFKANIAKADSLLEINKYQQARTAFVDAQKLNPNEQYIKDRVAEIDKIIDENYRLAKNNYDKKVVTADKYYKAKSYDKALNAYQEAINILPEENYAVSQAKLISDLFEASTIAVISNVPHLIKEKEQKRFNFTPIPIKERKSNYLYLLISKTEAKENLRLILNYGKDEKKNGGLIIRLEKLNSNGVYLVRVGTQYKWFSEDNNWINLQAEGGNIQVERIKISKGILGNN